jgi:EmrB/QacA subfamily drug resistance transporter
MENKKESLDKWLILFVIVLGSFMETLDSSIVNLAVSKMMHTFNTTLDQIQWVISAYALAVGIATPTTGYLGDRFGIKKIFIFAMILFTTGSLLCGTAWNTTSIIIFRIIQGMGGAILKALGTTILMSTFDKNERGMALALMGIVIMGAPAIGPTLGGYIIDQFDWRFIFLINIPIGICGTLLALFLLRESEHNPLKNFDLIGFLTSSISLGCILYILGKDNIDWSDIKNIMLTIIGCYSLLMFVINELMLPEPMLDLKLLKNYTFCMSTVIMNVSMLALLGGIFLMPIFLQQLKGLTPLQTGLVLFPEAIAIAISVVIAGTLSDKPGTVLKKTMIILGLVLLGINSYSMSKIAMDTSSTTILILLLVRGLGIGFLLAPVQVMGLNAVPQEMNSNASALLNTLQQVGSATGITLVTNIMQHRYALNYENLAEQVTISNPNSMNLFSIVRSLLMQNGLSHSDAQSGALGQLYSMVAQQAQLQALNDSMIIISIITLVIIFPALLLKENKPLDDKAFGEGSP